MNGEFHVADWFVQPQLGTITNGDQTVGLEPRVMEVLVYLAQQADEVLPKELIIQTVWKDAFVTDEVLTNAISTLRKAFGDESKNPAYIQTLPRRGYRLIAPENYPVDDSGLESRNLPDSDLGSGRRKPAVWFATGAILVVLATLWLVSLFDQSGPETPIDSVAVLHFDSATDDLRTESLAEGIPESISSSLLQLDGLRVKSPSVLKRYKGKDINPQTVSDEQGVGAVLTGRVERRGESLGVRVELIDGKENTLLWGQRYNSLSSDLLEIEADIARQVAQALRL